MPRELDFLLSLQLSHTDDPVIHCSLLFQITLLRTNNYYEKIILSFY